MGLGGGLLWAAGSAHVPGQTQAPMQMPAPSPNASAARQEDAAPADFTLRIAPIALELAPSRFISTIGYNGTSPGPVLRMREGKPVTVEVINDTDAPELVHWHGLFVPPEVDGAEEEGTPMVPPAGRRRYRRRWDYNFFPAFFRYP